MQTIKLLLNATVSERAKFMTADIKNFYLDTPLPNKEYMTVQLNHIPEDVQIKYDLIKFAHNGKILMEINKGIYGLPQAGKLSQDRLVTHLAQHGYHQAKHTPCLFKHESRPIAFTLVVDDFGIKYINIADAQHLLTTLRALYEITEDWSEVQKYVGITIKHDRANNKIQLSMPGYIEKALTRFGRTNVKGVDSPILYIPPSYGKAMQMMPTPSPSDDIPLTAAEQTWMQEVIGVFLFYSRAIDANMLTALNKLSVQQAAPTKSSLAATERFLQYAKQYQNSYVEISASDMQLQAHSDASYNSEAGGKSRAAGILYFSVNPNGSLNGIIDVFSTVIKTVCSAVAEAEYASLFLTGHAATSLRHTLIDLGYPQGTTEIICDNTCAVGIANQSIKQKRSKAIDMRYHWIRDQVEQQKMRIIWKPGKDNFADHFTKAQPVWYHKLNRHLFVCTPKRTVIQNNARSRRVARKHRPQD
jgi:hypothetical protein